MLLGQLALARPLVELAESEVAVGDEGAHAARLGERKRLAVVCFAALGVDPVGTGRDVAEQLQEWAVTPSVLRNRLDGALAQLLRLVESTQQQAGDGWPSSRSITVNTITSRDTLDGHPRPSNPAHPRLDTGSPAPKVKGT
jgi:hypothetical protein